MSDSEDQMLDGTGLPTAIESCCPGKIPTAKRTLTKGTGSKAFKFST